MAKWWQEVGAAEAGDIESGRLQAESRVCSARLKKLRPPDGAAFDGARLGEMVERPDAGGEVVQT